MAKYSKRAGDKVGEVMHEMKEGKLKSGSGKKVTSRKQAIAIGLSEARKDGAKVPAKKGSAKKTAPRKKAATKGAARKSAPKKAASKTARKTQSKKSAPKKKSGGRKGKSGGR